MPDEDHDDEQDDEQNLEQLARLDRSDMRMLKEMRSKNLTGSSDVLLPLEFAGFEQSKKPVELAEQQLVARDSDAEAEAFEINAASAMPEAFEINAPSAMPEAFAETEGFAETDAFVTTEQSATAEGFAEADSESAEQGSDWMDLLLRSNDPFPYRVHIGGETDGANSIADSQTLNDETAGAANEDVQTPSREAARVTQESETNTNGKHDGVLAEMTLLSEEDEALTEAAKNKPKKKGILNVPTPPSGSGTEVYDDGKVDGEEAFWTI